MIKMLELTKMKRTMDQLDNVKGSSTSMITLLIPSSYDLVSERKKLDFEYGTADCIKSRV